MTRNRTVQRLFGILGGLVVILMIVSTGVSVVHKQADLYTTGPVRKGHIDSSDPVTTISDFPAECQRFARSLAAGQNISLTEYRIGLWSITVQVRQTPRKGWLLSNANCATPLASATHLRVDNQSYPVYGYYGRSKLHQMPSFLLVQLFGVLLGAGMLVYGFEVIHRGGQRLR